MDVGKNLTFMAQQLPQRFENPKIDQCQITVDGAKSRPAAAVQFENNKQWAFIFCKFITYSYVCTGVGTSTSVAIRISKS